MTSRSLTCIVCPIGCTLKIDETLNVTGNKCKRGSEFGKKELTNPTRMVTTTIKIENAIHDRLPVVSSTGVPKTLVKEVVKEVQKSIIHAPIHEGDIIVENILNTGVHMIAARTMIRQN